MPIGGAPKYDQVILQRQGGGTRELSRREFEALPLRERVSYLITGAAQFYARGISVSPSEAMKG